MDSLGALGDALAAPARLRPPAAAGGGGDADLPDVLQHSGVVQEVYARHGRSAQPESRQVIAILQAVLEVLKAEGLPPTPTALFAALMSSLEKPETLGSNEVLAAMCTLLSLVLPRLPNTVLAGKAGQCSGVLATVVGAKAGEPGVLRPALGCLAAVLAAAGPSDWPGALQPFNLLLSACLDPRPKVRKRAQGGLVTALAGLRHSPATLAPAAEAVLRLCQKVVPAPEAAARAAAAAPHKRRAAAEEAITAAVADALHLLGALRQTLFLLPAATVAPVCELLLKLYALRQPLLSRHTSDVLAALASSTASELPPRALAQLLGAVVTEPAAWEGRDSDAALALARLMQEGFVALHRAEPALAAAHLPRAFHALVPQLGAEQEALRAVTADCLRELVSECVDERMVAAAASAAPGSPPAPLASVIAALEGVLGARYRDCWELALPVAAELMGRLGQPGAALADGLIERIGEICSGGDEAAEAAGDDEPSSDDVVMAAQEALGAALRSVGPEAVLEVLPLAIQEGLDSGAEARSWLLPLLRMHVRGARLAYWGQALLPLARTMAARAAKARSRSDERSRREAKICAALEAQVWAMLPSFCSWALDGDTAFRTYAKDLAGAFDKRPDLRVVICQALARLASQSRRVANAAGGQQVGFADPSAAAAAAVPEEAGGEGGEDDEDQLPEGFTAEMAAKNLAMLRSMAKNWLPLLLNAFLSSPPEQRGHIRAAISAYACACDTVTLAPLYRTAITKLLKVMEQERTGELGPGAVLDGGDSDTERRCTYMEAALALAGGLDAAALETLFKAAKPGVQEKNPAVQKKAYKVLAYLAGHRADFMAAHGPALLELATSAAATAVSAARRYRLAFVRAVALALVQEPGTLEPGAPGATVLPQIVSEIVLSLKEANKKTRAEAYALLVELGSAMQEAIPVVDGDPQSGGLYRLFSWVLGGLVGTTPHMISASVMALARLLYEFAPSLAGLVPQLLPAVLLLLRSKAREVIKSVLGFVKVVAVRLPAEELLPFLPQILEGLLIWAEDSKNKFRAKVRVIVERLAKKCGFEEVERHIPEAHRRLFTHIRKQTNRQERAKSVAGSQMDWEEDARTVRSRAHTARSVGGKIGAAFSDIFSDDTRDARTATGRTATTRGGKGAARAALPGSLGSGGSDPVDLLDARTSRQLVKAGAAGRGGRRRADEEEDDFKRDESGRMVIEEEKPKGGKRKRSDDLGMDEEDSDFDELRQFERSGLALALKGAKGVAMAPSIAASFKSARGARSEGGASQRSGKSAKTVGRRGEGGKSHTSGERYRSKKAGGDIKGKAKLEPFAYWPLDRRLLNARREKRREGQEGLKKVVVSGGKHAKKKARR